VAGQRFTFPQLEGLWDRAGGRRAMAPVMAAIAEVESSGDSEPTPGKLGNNPGTATGLPGAEGLWQMEWPLYQGYGGAQSPEQMLDPMTNARAAVELSRNDPSTAPGHPVWDNWIQFESTDSAGRPAYTGYLSGKPPAAPPGGSGDSLNPVIHLGPFSFTLPLGGLVSRLVADVQGFAITGALVAGAAGLAVWGVARAARSTRGDEA